MEIALTTTNQLEIINSKDFIQEVLYKSVPVFICHVAIIESSLLEMHLSQIAQISVATTELVILTNVYKDFEDSFLTKDASKLLPHKDYNHANNPLDDKQPPDGPIYSLFENNLLILQTYIDQSMANSIYYAIQISY